MSASARTHVGGPGHNGPKLFSAIVNPTVANDASDNIEVGDMWVNTVTPAVLVCTSNANGAAVWLSGVATTKVGFVNLGTVATATTSGKATQLDLSGGPAAMASIVQPDVPRNVKLTITDGNTSISAFSIVVVGTAPDGTAVTETFTFASGLTPAGSKIFATVTSVTVASIVGYGASDTLDLGYGVKLGVPVPATSTNLVITKLAVTGANENPSATDTTNNSFTATTAPNGTRIYTVFFTYT